MLTQFIHDGFIALAGKGPARGAARFLFRLARRLILAFGDPLIEAEVEGARLAVPLSHALPEYLKVFPHYASNLGRLAAALKRKYPDLAVIDIGANIGDSIAVIRRGADAPVLCVEGNPVFLKTLRLNASRFGRVSVAENYVGEKEGSLMAEDRMLGGTSHIAEGGSREIKVKPLSLIAAGYPGFEAAKLVKIDTDGFDCKIIRGSADFLAAARPAVFFEYDPLLLARQNDEGLSVFAALRGAGYSSALVYDNLGHFMLSLELSEERLLTELHAHFYSYRGDRFGDICAFHSEDAELCAELARSETQYLEKSAAGGAAF